MKKRILAVTLAVILVLALACPAGACGAPARPAASAALRAAEQLVDSSNQTIAFLVRCAQLTPYNDVPALLASVEAVVSVTVSAVHALGFGVECDYTEYIIDGQHVLIDPLRVINPIIRP